MAKWKKINLKHVQPPLRLPPEDAADEFHASFGQAFGDFKFPLQDGMLQGRDGVALEGHRTCHLVVRDVYSKAYDRLSTAQ